MAKYLRTKPQKHSPKYLNKKTSDTPKERYLRTVRKNIYRQAMLAVVTIVLTVVIMFAMTSAWYTNIVQTSGLTFEAEAWGFDGTIAVDDRPIEAAPGDEGIVHLTVDNDSDSLSTISVNIAKNGMQDEMKKRIFFYVDIDMERNGEVMDRVYLNKYEGYTYEVFSKNQLTLTEQISNAPVIKWQWVYDMLGYYVLAEPYEIERVDEVVNEDGTITANIVRHTQLAVKEYLRPIEYNFDEITTVINEEDGKMVVEIETVDGTTSLENFLYQISEHDGYEGEIEQDDKMDFGNYYAVDVDKNGYGVYAYLCNYGEVMLATQYDTKLGNLADKKAKGESIEGADLALMTHTATLTLSAQKAEGNAIMVNTLGGLQSAIAQNQESFIQLTGDITLIEGESLTIPEDARVMLDLNGNQIIGTNKTAIKAQPGSSLTMLNGTLIRGETTSTAQNCAVYAVGAEVVMSDIDVKDFPYGIYVGDDDNNNELDSRVYMVDCNINAKSYAVFVSGNGVLSERKLQLVIEDCVLTSGSIVLTGNGDSSGNGRWGTDIQIIRSTINGGTTATAIYHPQKNSTMTVYDSTIKGYNGITIKGGRVDLVDSIINGTGNYEEPEFVGSGFTDTGDAVYIETGYGYPIELNIQNSQLMRDDPNSNSLRVFEQQSKVVKVNIESGTFDEQQPEDYIAKNAEQIIGADGKATVRTKQ